VVLELLAVSADCHFQTVFYKNAETMLVYLIDSKAIHAGDHMLPTMGLVRPSLHLRNILKLADVHTVSNNLIALSVRRPLRTGQCINDSLVLEFIYCSADC
jgi:hypothetical protein